MKARYYEKFENEVKAAMIKEFNYTTPMAVPRITKIVINMGLGEATQNPKIVDSAVEELGAIAGQQPTVRKARKSIATFKLRQGMPIGCAVTLRRDRMYEFFDRFVNITMPRVRDFRGLSTKGFDGRGNYTVGLRDQLIFPEIDFNKVEKTKGLSVTICTSAKSDAEAQALLKMMDFPFRQ